jgi:hypothetical protein
LDISQVAHASNKQWMAPKHVMDACYDCLNFHPGFRHETSQDKVVIQYNPIEDRWGPGLATGDPANRCYVPTFLLPTPPKFATVEEADRWMESHLEGNTW